MKKTILKIFLIFISMILIGNVTNTYASSLLGEAMSGANNFISSSKGNVSIDDSKLKKTSSDIYNVLLMISFVVVAIVGISLGIKYMMSGVEEKADIKQSLIIFFIGCLVVYGAFGIWKVLVTFLNTI